jgi:peptide/nickel transport system permease protein
VRGGFSPIAVVLAGNRAPPEDIRRIERDLDLDSSLAQQYASFMARLVRGDLGFSYAAGAPVVRLIGPAVPATASVALGASVLWVVAGTAVGVGAARSTGRWSSAAFTGFASGALSVPVFVAALGGLAIVFRLTGVYVGNTYVPLTRDPVLWLEAMWLPWISLALPLVAVYARTIRGNLLEIGSEDYIRTAYAKGLTDKQVLRHELRAGLAPVVTMYGLDLGALLSGSVIIEEIFRIPGVGRLLLQSFVVLDFPVMAGVVMFASACVVVIAAVIDILYGVIDPRVATRPLRAA